MVLKAELEEAVVEVLTLPHLAEQQTNLHKTVVSQILHNLVSLVALVVNTIPVHKEVEAVVVLALLVKAQLMLVMEMAVLAVLVEQTLLQALL